MMQGRNVPSPIQPNGTNCGLFLFHTAEYILSNYAQLLWDCENGVAIDAKIWYEPSVAVKRHSFLRREIERACWKMMMMMMMMLWWKGVIRSRSSLGTCLVKFFSYHNTLFDNLWQYTVQSPWLPKVMPITLNNADLQSLQAIGANTVLDNRRIRLKCPAYDHTR